MADWHDGIVAAIGAFGGLATAVVVGLFARRKVKVEAEAAMIKVRSEADAELTERFERLSASMEQRLQKAEDHYAECVDDRVVLQGVVSDLISAVTIDNRADRIAILAAARRSIQGMHARRSLGIPEQPGA